MRFKRPVQSTLLLLLVLFVALQVVPVSRTNPPVDGAIELPADVDAVLRQSCYYCHSHETEWPWYSFIAPFSWRVVDHVRQGRERLNFSTWNNEPDHRRTGLLAAIREVVDSREMPEEDYVRFHPDAAVTPEGEATVIRWLDSQGVTIEHYEAWPE